MRHLIFLLLLVSTAWAQSKPLGSVMFSTTGAGAGTLCEMRQLDKGRAELKLTWKGRGANQGAIRLTRAQIETLQATLEKALTARPGDFPGVTSEGSRLDLQNQSDGDLRVTYLILKPPGKTKWNDWVIAQVNLKPAETTALRQMLDKTRKALR